MKELPCGGVSGPCLVHDSCPRGAAAPFYPGVCPRGVWATSSTWYIDVALRRQPAAGVLFKGIPLQDRLHALLQHPRSRGSACRGGRAGCRDEPGHPGSARSQALTVVVAISRVLASARERLFGHLCRGVDSRHRKAFRDCLILKLMRDDEHMSASSSTSPEYQVS